MAFRGLPKAVINFCRDRYAPRISGFSQLRAPQSYALDAFTLVRAFSSCRILPKCRDQVGGEREKNGDRHAKKSDKRHRNVDDGEADEKLTHSVTINHRAEPIPRRAIMYVPGNDLRKLEKVRQLHNLDSIVLDHEDGVAETSKDEARKTIRKVLDDEQFFGERYQRGKDIGVRINSVSLHGERALEDLRSTLHARMLPTSVFLPKVEHEEEVQWLLEHAWSTLHERPPPSTTLPPLRLVLYIESAHALLRANKICKKSLSFLRKLPDSSTGHSIEIDALVFGADDYIADIDAQKTPRAQECSYARQHLVTVAKAHRLQAIDMVWIDYKDADGLRLQAEEGRQFGFTGKQIIHPSQIEPVQAAFSPSAEQIEWARALLAAYEDHNTSGRGAFTFRDKMIDRPLVLQARNILATTTTPFTTQD